MDKFLPKKEASERAKKDPQTLMRYAKKILTNKGLEAYNVIVKKENKKILISSDFCDYIAKGGSALAFDKLDKFDDKVDKENDKFDDKVDKENDKVDKVVEAKNEHINSLKKQIKTLEQINAIEKAERLALHKRAAIAEAKANTPVWKRIFGIVDKPDFEILEILPAPREVQEIDPEEKQSE